MKTVTPAPPAVCPTDNPDFIIPAELLNFLRGIDNWENASEFEVDMLYLLNAGAKKQLLDRRDFTVTDLTGDSIPELVSCDGRFPIGNLFVFGCSEGKYVKLHEEPTVYEHCPSIVDIRDMNLNGMKELAIEFTTCNWYSGAKILEWQEDQFASLVSASYYGTPVDMATLDGYSSVKVEDVDGNRTYELVLEGGIPSWLGGLSGFEGPYRSRKLIYFWNGANYILVFDEFEAPRFRFEAVQDGDAASERGDYDKALSFYQDVIFCDKLKSFSMSAWLDLLNDPAHECCTPPDVSLMSFDQVEYSQLSAYSRYRIMLLHIIRGWKNEAQIVYETLIKKYPPENPGYPYAQLAAEFWNEYAATQDISLACGKAVAFAQQHEGILVPLGNDHGSFVRRYRPEDICPFK